MIHLQKKWDMEEFEKNLVDIFYRREHTVQDADKNKEEIKNFISQIYITICKNEIERLEDTKENLKKHPIMKKNFHDTIEENYDYNEGVDNTLQTQILYWQDELTKLTK